MWGLRSSRTLVILAAATAFVIACVLPPLYMLSAILHPEGGESALRGVLLDTRQQGLLYTTLLLGAGTSVLATLVGGALGLVLARIRLPFKAPLRIALVAPAVLPPYVIALAWSYLAENIAFTVWGAIAVLTSALYPLSMLATEVALRQVDPRLEEAALLAAPPAHVLRRITAPLVFPTVISAALMVFVLAISDFSVPAVLRVRVFTTEVFSAFAALYDSGRAMMLSLPLVILSTVVAVAAAIALGTRLVTTTRTRGGTPIDAFDRWRLAAAVTVCAAICLMLILPLIALVREALRSPSVVPAISGSREAAFNSLVLALLGATVVTTLAAGVGYARAHATAKTGAAVDALWVVLFAVPSTVVGIGLIGMWNRPNALGLYGTRAMLVLAYVARFAPVGALALAAIVRAVPRSHEEAAAVAGAGWLRTIAHIVLPQIRVGLLAVWVITLILAFGEVGTSILVAPPGESTLPIRVYTLTANAPPGHVAALALFQSFVILIPLTLLGIALARRNAP
jgi:iron(III) transport system permease protein